MVAALSVSACAPPSPAKPPKPSPSSTALFATDEEALAAAEEAYREYQHVADSIFIDGGRDPERLLEVATQSQYEYEKAGYDKVLALGYRSTGGSTFDSARIEKSGADEAADLSIFVCEDITAVDIRDANDASIVKDDRPDRFPLLVSFVSGRKPSSLVVSKTEDWAGEDTCLEN